MKDSKLKFLAKKSKNITEFSIKYINYLHKIFNKLDFRELEKLNYELNNLRKRKSTLFVIGNGGGAATALTIANDLGFDILKKTKSKNTFKILSLTENSSVVTAIANDTSYNDIFVNQLKIHFTKGDKLLIFSASGNSKNLIRAAKWVKQRKGRVMSILGFDGGQLSKISDVCLHFPTSEGEYGPVEDSQLIINHILAHWYQVKIK